MDYRLISIGSLSRHELWGETQPVRTAHSTTTLIRHEQRVILVDPGLPAVALTARLHERSGLKPEQVTDIFLTNFRPAHRGGLDAFPHAALWISEMEREAVGRLLVERFQQADEAEREMREALRREIALLKRFQPAPDRLVEHVDLFPLPGFTPGNCGLLLLEPRRTVLIAGDAVPTREHLLQGRILPHPYDADQAGESLREVFEVADAVICGHDELVLNPGRT